MKLMDEIVDILSTEDGSLTDALLKTKVLLHSLDQTELIVWVNSELNGYGDQQELPNYRRIPAHVLANLTAINFNAKAHPIPIGHLTKEQCKGLETANMSPSLSVLEKFSRDPDGNLQTLIPLEFNNLLGKNLAQGVSIQLAWSQVEISSIVQLSTEVRSRLLDFVLRLKEQLPNDSANINAQSVDARSIFNNAILGDNATIIIGDKNSADIVNLHLKDNFEALTYELKKFNVPDSDIDDLERAIRNDESTVNQNSKEFGPAVQSWIQSMLHKAVETAWQIELGMASAVLTDALSHYYGWWQ